MDDRKRYFDDGAAAWDEKIAQNRRHDKLARVAEWFQAKEGEALLDVGTGTGALIPLLESAIGRQGTLAAMDFSYNMLQKAASLRPGIHAVLINAAVGAIPFRSGSFDKVTCFSAFPHFPDKQGALAEMVRVLKQNGMVFIAHLHSIEEIAQLHGAAGEAVRRDRLPDREAMLRLMEGAGLSEIAIINEPGKFLAYGKRR